MVAKAVASSIVLVAQAVLAGAAWVLQPVLALAAWVLNLGLIVAGAISSAITIAAQAVIAGAAWILEAAKASAAWILGWIKMLPFNLGVATGMAANAVIAGSSWVAQAKLASAAWISTGVVLGLVVAAAVASLVFLGFQISKAIEDFKFLDRSRAKLDTSRDRALERNIIIQRLQKGQISKEDASKQLHALKLYKGGIVEQVKYASGGVAKAANGMIAGQSALRDRVSALLTPGELVLNKAQQKKLLDGGAGGTNITRNVNINVGTMIATPGERREFAREIEKLLNQNMARLAT